MKTKRIVFIILGWLFIFFQTIFYLAAFGKKEPVFEEYNVGYILGSNFMVILGIIFLLMANKQKRKMKRKAELETLDSFLVQQ